MSDKTLQTLQHALQREPFFHVRKMGNQLVTSGATSGQLGHQVTTPGARTGEGVYASWQWDGTTLRAHVDECGFYPLYYYATDTECAISPSIPALLHLGAPSELDYSALSVFLRIGWYIGADTPFKAIRAFLPAGSLEWSSGHTTVTGEIPIGKASHLTRSQGIDGYVELFRASLKRRLPADQDFTVLLTGGRDSRHQLFELERAGHKPKEGHSIGEYVVCSNDEMVVASAIAEAVGIKHVIINQTESPFVLEQRNNVATNFCADEHSWLWPLADYLRGKYKVVYDGLGGSIWDRGFQLTEHRLDLCEAGKLEQLADSFLLQDDTLRLLSPSLLSQCPREMAVARIAQDIGMHIDSPNPIDSFLFWTRTRRESALSSCRVLDSSHTVICPFIDLELVNHLASLPGRMMLDHNFHDETIHRAFPQYAHIPFGPKGGPLHMEYKHARQLTWELSRYVFSKPPSQSLRYMYLLPRMARCLVDTAYSSSILWMGLYSLYVLQLEELPSQINMLRHQLSASTDRIAP